MGKKTLYTWDCDICEQKLETEEEFLPRGWGRFKVETLSGTCFGGTFDVCPKCVPQNAYRSSVKKMAAALFRRFT